MKSLNCTKIIFTLLFTIFIISNTNTFAKPMPSGEEEYLLVTDKSASPVGGVDGVMKKIYSETSLKGKLKGKLYLLVYVNETGGVEDVKIVKGFGGKESDAIEIVEKTKFSPGVNGSTPVKSKVALALNFE